MGSVSTQIKAATKLNDVLLSLDRAQDYLLFAAELNDPKWSALAANEIYKAYDESFKNILNITTEKKEDKILAKHEQLQKQKKTANDLLENIENLRDKVTPETENKHIKECMKKMDALEKRIQQFLASNTSVNTLTEEAKKLEAPKREGH